MKLFIYFIFSLFLIAPLAYADEIGGGQRAVVSDSNLSNPTIASDYNTHAACLAHKNSDGTFTTGWTACTAFEAAYATRVADAESAIAASVTTSYTAALARLAMPP